MQNYKFTVKGISLLNSVISSSSSVQFGEIAGNEVSPTKQASGDNGKEPKLHRWQNGEKTLRETKLIQGASSPPARRTSSLFQLQQRSANTEWGNSYI